MRRTRTRIGQWESQTGPFRLGQSTRRGISLQLKLIKLGARVVRHARAITLQLAEVAVTSPMVRAILTAIRRLRAPPLCA
jgi:hypothetical protein